MNTNYNF